MRQPVPIPVRENPGRKDRQPALAESKQIHPRPAHACVLVAVERPELGHRRRDLGQLAKRCGSCGVASSRGPWTSCSPCPIPGAARAQSWSLMDMEAPASFQGGLEEERMGKMGMICGTLSVASEGAADATWHGQQGVLAAQGEEVGTPGLSRNSLTPTQAQGC